MLMEEKRQLSFGTFCLLFLIFSLDCHVFMFRTCRHHDYVNFELVWKISCKEGSWTLIVLRRIVLYNGFIRFGFVEHVFDQEKDEFLHVILVICMFNRNYLYQFIDFMMNANSFIIVTCFYEVLYAFVMIYLS